MTAVHDDSAPGARPHLTITDLSKSFGRFVALSGISFDIAEGEFVCFLGPSGCGKTTLLRAIAGLEVQSSGHIELAGRDISRLPPAERDFGIVFQSYALFPNLTVARNIAYGLENRKLGRDAIAARVDELLTLVGLGDQGGKYPAQLSGGQQQRVALARAIATSPGLLLLDEPLSALDAKVRARLRHEIKELQRRLGVTTVMVTHDQEEALTMADRIVVMNAGVIDQIGTPHEIYLHPATPFVADFIGSMNFLEGTVADPGRARVGDADLAADLDGHTVGGAVVLALRPEEVRIAADGVNGFEAEVVGVEFLGAFVRAELRVAALGGQRLHADVAVEQSGWQGVDAGQRLAIALPREHLRAFAARPGDG